MAEMKKAGFTAASSVTAGLAVLLMRMPKSAYLTFAPSPTNRIDSFFSYFDTILLGYANIFPILTGALAVMVLILNLIAALQKRVYKKGVFALSVACAACSLLALATLAKHPFIPAVILLLLSANAGICYMAKIKAAK